MATSWTIQPLESGRRRVVVVGDFDLASEHDFVADVDQAFLAEGVTSVLLDFEQVEFLDSSGVRALLRLRESHGAAVRLVAASRAVRRVLDIAGVTEAVMDGESQPR